MNYNYKLFQEARRCLVGGVNSPLRSFKGVGGYPVFIKRAKGARIFSQDARDYIDYCQGYGALILGHAHPLVLKEIKNELAKGTVFGAPTKEETELAKIINCAIPSIEKIRLTNSGTEAVMGAIRLARGFSKRDKVLKFAGCYHGHADYLLDSAGVPKDFKKHTLTTPYNDIRKAEELVKKYKNDIAAVIVEPVAGNMGLVLPKKGFLKFLREITKKHDILLIFDEIITGFRLIFGGAQGLFGIKPDLTCLGKIIGGGFPIGAFGGRKEIMQLLAPEGNVYQAGTFSGNPISVKAGITTLKVLSQNNPYKSLEVSTRHIAEELKKKAEGTGFNIKINFIGPMFSVFFCDKEVIDYNSAKAQDTGIFKRFYHGLLKEGVYLSPSGFETNFLSTAHTSKDLEKTIDAIDKVFRDLSQMKPRRTERSARKSLAEFDPPPLFVRSGDTKI